MTDIVLATLNARYIHASFGLRYLKANLGQLSERAEIREWTIQKPVAEIVEELLEASPRIVGLGVYIWNVEQTTLLVQLLKRVMPDVVVVVGGPEVSYEWQQQPIVAEADYAVLGEAEFAFRDLCAAIFEGDPPKEPIIRAPLPPIGQLQMPYDLYDDEDIAHRVIYVEASRGCPFKCEFCLSSLDIPVRKFDLDAFLGQMEMLFERGVRTFKFVDRTFNLNLKISAAILDFFYARYEPGLFLHFEMIPDRFPEALRESVRRFPPGSLQFEVGIQTFNEEVSALISRRQDLSRLEDNLRFLREQTGVHVHADLIAGLPGEGLESFAAGFDRLVALAPQEIQLGILKRLRGTPISRHDETHQMVYSPQPPFEILQNDQIDFATMQKLMRFAKYWDKIANSGNFQHSLKLLWQTQASPFWAFWDLSEWLYRRFGRIHGISLHKMMESFFGYLLEVPGASWDEQGLAEVFWQEHSEAGHPKVPAFLKRYVKQDRRASSDAAGSLTARQARHRKSP